ncbi:hypothetical protein Ancab_026695 [Ancistrocladus abbreviatus]
MVSTFHLTLRCPRAQNLRMYTTCSAHEPQPALLENKHMRPRRVVVQLVNSQASTSQRLHSGSMPANTCKLFIFFKRKSQNFMLSSLQTKPISSSPLPTSPSSSLPSSPVPTHRHIALLVLEQKSASQALQTFRWASKLPSFTHDCSTYRAVIHKLCVFRQFDTVDELLDEMPRSTGSPPDEDIFVTIVRGLGHAHRIREVIRVLDLVVKFELTPSLKIYNSILDVLVKHDIDIAREFYRRKMMDCGVEGDDYTFGILMKGLCLTNRIGDGFKLLQVMKSRGVIPNTVVYNTILHALCKNGKVGRARSLMTEIPEPNDVTYNLLISAYCKEENLVQALVLMEKSFSSGFVPDLVTVTKVVELLCSVGRLNEAVEVLERVESNGGGIDVVAYNTLIKGFCEAGKAKVALHFLKEMENKGCLPNADTYNVLISGFCEINMLNKALDLFDSMKNDGIRWNFATYDTLIRGFCFRGRAGEAFKILEMMEESKEGSGVRVSPYNNIIYGLYWENRLEEAVDFLKKMEKLFPRAIDRSLSILRLCEEGNVENAKKVYEQMTKEGSTPSILVYSCVIHAFCQHGCVREAFDLMNEMVGCGYLPSPSICNAVISGFCSQGKVTSALKLMEDMVGRGCVPEVGTYSPLIDVLCKNEDLQGALRIFWQMVGKGIAPDLCTWNALLMCLSKEKQQLGLNNVGHVTSQIRKIIET